jgi:ATP-dependent protease ClpP protease subunit
VRILNKKLAKMMVEEPIKASVSTEEDKLFLYGTIGDAWDGVTLEYVRRMSSRLDKTKLTVHINSYGGDATEGVAIRNYIKSTFDEVDVVIDGIAASAASVIATCGNTLTMPSGTTFMIHNPWAYVIGNKSDLQKEIGALESLEQSYRDIYMERFNGTEDELGELMENESWLTAEQAETFGFATKTVKTDGPVEPVETQDNLLIASLLNKYSAKNEDAKAEENSANDDLEDMEESEEDEESTENKQNAFLSNLVKTFNV